MIILYSLIFIFFLYYIISGFTMFVTSVLTIKDMKRANEDKSKISNNYYIFLPVFKEQNIIEDSIEYFYNLTKDENKIKLFIIATEREDDIYINDLCKTTYEIAKNKIHNLNLDNKIILLKAPRESTGKVGQLNYAYNYLKKKEIDGYIGVYDIDSRPTKNVFYIMENIMKNEKIKPEIFQQVSSYCNGIEKMKGFKGALAIADAFSQTRWALGFEYPIYKLYNNQVQKNKLRPLIYCIGHGCFINIEFLNRIDGFPNINVNDDLSLGYLASTLGIKVHPIPLLDYCEIAPNPGMSIKQYKFWFSGSSRYYKDIKNYKQKYKIKLSKIQNSIFYLQGGIRNFLWAWRSNIILLITLLSIILQWRLGIIFSLMSWLIYVIIPFYSTYIELKRINHIKVRLSMIILGIISSPINFIIRGIGPCIAMTTNFRGKKNIKYKTER